MNPNDPAQRAKTKRAVEQKVGAVNTHGEPPVRNSTMPSGFNAKGECIGYVQSLADTVPCRPGSDRAYGIDSMVNGKPVARVMGCGI